MPEPPPAAAPHPPRALPPPPRPPTRKPPAPPLAAAPPPWPLPVTQTASLTSRPTAQARRRADVGSCSPPQRRDPQRGRSADYEDRRAARRDGASAGRAEPAAPPRGAAGKGGPSGVGRGGWGWKGGWSVSQALGAPPGLRAGIGVTATRHLPSARASPGSRRLSRVRADGEGQAGSWTRPSLTAVGSCVVASRPEQLSSAPLRSLPS